jgi:hypothetical protein
MSPFTMICWLGVRTGTVPPQLAITVTLRNNSDAPIKAPFAVKVSNVDSACLNIQLEDAANDGTGGSAVWALSDAFPGGVLASGATG